MLSPKPSLPVVWQRSVLILLLVLPLSGCAWLQSLFGTTTTTTTTTTTVTTCGTAGCCCNSPIVQSNPSAGRWPDCDAGFQCVAMQPGGVVVPNYPGRIDVNVCRDRNAPLTAPVQLASNQPSYCRTDVP